MTTAKQKLGDFGEEFVRKNFDCPKCFQTKLEFQRAPMEFAGRHHRHHHQTPSSSGQARLGTNLL